MSAVQGSAALREDYEQIQKTEEDSGKIGFDLSRFDNSESVRELRTKEAGAVTKRKPRAKHKVHLSFLTGLCCVGAAAIAALMLMSYLNLTIINDEIAQLQNEYLELQNKNVLLQTEYESRYDLNEIEDYAVNTLGMIKLERSQVEYVEIANPDSIRAISPEDNDATSYITANFVKSFNAVLDFIQNSGN